MADVQRSTSNTPLGSFGTQADGPGDGVGHDSKTRPDDAGFVFGNEEEHKRRQGGVAPGTLMSTITTPGEPAEARTVKDVKAEVKANEKADTTGATHTEPVVSAERTEDDDKREAMMAGAIATNADNTPGPRPSPEAKAEAKERINVPSETKSDGQVRPASTGSEDPAVAKAKIEEV